MKKNLLHGAVLTVIVVTLETNRPPALSPGTIKRAIPSVASKGWPSPAPKSDEHLLVPEIG